MAQAGLNEPCQHHTGHHHVGDGDKYRQFVKLIEQRFGATVRGPIDRRHEELPRGNGRDGNDSQQNS